MSCDVDVVVLGAGPAGCAAAIWAASLDLQVVILESLPFPRHRPGETLHPGAASILRQLGVEKQVEKASTIRHQGHSVLWGDTAEFLKFGADATGDWRGYQIWRERLDCILLDRARHVGVKVLQPYAADTPIMDGNRVGGIRGTQHIPARFVIDATGGRGWLRRRLHLRLEIASPTMRAYYGYCEGEFKESHLLPALIGGRRGWIWLAQVDVDVFHWTRFAFPGTNKRNRQRPAQFTNLRQLGHIRAADVTWRRVTPPAGFGYFLTGDAATVTDPASSHGVLRALMSGMMAAHSIKKIMSGDSDEMSAIHHYCAWTERWYRDDLKNLAAAYRKILGYRDWLSRTG
jgi:flavin-dependent dehydrogenase